MGQPPPDHRGFRVGPVRRRSPRTRAGAYCACMHGRRAARRRQLTNRRERAGAARPAERDVEPRRGRVAVQGRGLDITLFASVAGCTPACRSAWPRVPCRPPWQQSGGPLELSSSPKRPRAVCFGLMATGATGDSCGSPRGRRTSSRASAPGNSRSRVSKLASELFLCTASSPGPVKMPNGKIDSGPCQPWLSARRRSGGSRVASSSK